MYYNLTISHEDISTSSSGTGIPNLLSSGLKRYAVLPLEVHREASILKGASRCELVRIGAAPEPRLKKVDVTVLQNEFGFDLSRIQPAPLNSAS